MPGSSESAVQLGIGGNHDVADLYHVASEHCKASERPIPAPSQTAGVNIFGLRSYLRLTSRVHYTATK